MMNNSQIILASFAAGAATYIGVLIGLRKDYGGKGMAFGAAFAAGIMILISSLELFPAAVEQSGLGRAIIFLLAGGTFLALANRFIPHLHSIDEIKNCDRKCMARASYLVVIGMILHDFAEGFAIPSSFDHSTSLGLVLFLTTFVHNIPEGYAMTVGGVLRKSFYLKSAFISSLVAVGGATLGLALLSYFSSLSSVFLALASGAMLYISTHELLPLAWHKKEKRSLAFGAITSLILFFLLGLI